MGHPPEKEREHQPRPGAGERDDLPELMERVREGSTRALQELIDCLWDDLVRFAAWETGDLDGAQDLVQEAFIYVWDRRRAWVQSASPRAFLYRIVRHQILDQQRKKKVRETWAARAQLRPRPSPPDPAETLAATRVEEAFSEAVTSLPPRRRQAFNLVVLRGLSHREAAEVLDISGQTVANQVSTALQKIREALRVASDEVT